MRALTRGPKKTLVNENTKGGKESLVGGRFKLERTRIPFFSSFLPSFSLQRTWCSEIDPRDFCQFAIRMMF